MPEQVVLSNVTGKIARLTFNRPDKLNALSKDLLVESIDLLTQWSRDSSIGAVVVTGAGRAFCAGGDLREIASIPPRRFTALQNAVAANIRKAPQCVIAAVNGAAIGGGAALALACDVRLASPDAVFRFAFPGLAAADMGVARLLPRTVGLGRATEWLLTGREIPAAEALAAGLVSRLLPRELLVAEARAMALRISSGSREALAVTKRLLDREVSPAVEAREQARLMGRPDFREACRAFSERREPRFNAD